MKRLLKTLITAIILSGLSADLQADNFTKFRAAKQNPPVVKSEYIGLNSAKINGKIPCLTKTNSLFKLVGKPLQLTKPDLSDYCGSFYNKPFKQVKVKGIEAEIYGDTAVVRSINLKQSPNLSLETKLMSLNCNTTLVNLRTVFPNAVKSRVVLNDLKLGKTVAVHIAIEKELEDSWLLLFKDGKLVRIDYYRPC